MVHIVLGYDGSPAAEAGLAWVADRAARGRVTVELVTVTNMLRSDYAQTAATLEEGSRRLKDVAGGIDVETHWRDGSMPNTLIDQAESADLLVIGVTQSHPVRTALKGWIPARTAARAKVPTVLVPEGWTPHEHAVMVGVDDDPSSDAAILYAAHEATDLGVPLRLVHAWQMPVPTVDGAVALLASPLEIKNAHRKLLEEAGQRVLEAYPELGVEAVLVGDNPASALLARAERTSLLVLGTHHRGLWAGAALGSVAQDILFQVPCPVCVVPNPGAD
ncbi:universal stress protein [Microbacterium ulmi]|uniref:Universal stress protein n=1 Tax=Microbacterium ulmi TaxID=179095 RepID=A0A7Y2PYD4_9MICO|nr:universal stress protein [Microbacterium ulmi]NII69823.1 nucleotide-binding universal stress UspA family protein [Microbacterium ulmi]NNH03206.1 universal stress protein [Microbacterium ulmi]